MNIKLIFPQSNNELADLQRRIDIIHSDMIINTLNALDLSYSDKLLLLDKVKESILHKSNTLSNLTYNTN